MVPYCGLTLCIPVALWFFRSHRNPLYSIALSCSSHAEFSHPPEDGRPSKPGLVCGPMSRCRPGAGQEEGRARRGTGRHLFRLWEGRAGWSGREGVRACCPGPMEIQIPDPLVGVYRYQSLPFSAFPIASAPLPALPRPSTSLRQLQSSLLSPSCPSSSTHIHHVRNPISSASRAPPACRRAACPHPFDGQGLEALDCRPFSREP